MVIGIKVVVWLVVDVGVIVVVKGAEGESVVVSFGDRVVGFVGRSRDGLLFFGWETVRGIYFLVLCANIQQQKKKEREGVNWQQVEIAMKSQLNCCC